MPVLDRLARQAGEVVSKEIREKGGRKLADQAGHEVAREVASKTAKRAATTIGRDVLATSGKDAAKKVAKKAVEEAANPAFEAAMAAVRERISKQGQYVNLSGPLMEALTHAKTTEESLQVAALARKFSVRFNQANRGALLHALESAAGNAKVHDEAFKTLAEVVRTRQEAYALFSLAEKNKIVETAVEKYVQVGGVADEDLASKAIRLVKARFDQHSVDATIKKVTLLDTVAEKIRTIANFINKALG